MIQDYRRTKQIRLRDLRAQQLIQRDWSLALANFQRCDPKTTQWQHNQIISNSIKLHLSYLSTCRLFWYTIHTHINAQSTCGIGIRVHESGIRIVQVLTLELNWAELPSSWGERTQSQEARVHSKLSVPGNPHSTWCTCTSAVHKKQRTKWCRFA